MFLVTLLALKTIKTLRMYKISSNYFKIVGNRHSEDHAS